MKAADETLHICQEGRNAHRRLAKSLRAKGFGVFQAAALQYTGMNDLAPTLFPSFETLTVRGQVRRMRLLAWNALSQYDLKVKGLHFLGWFTNLMFRVITEDGKTYVLRICAPDWRTEEDRRAEVAWLLALAGERGIEAPVPQPTRNGTHIVTAQAAGVPGDRQCLLMSWVPGVNLGKRLTGKNLVKMGTLFARLHSHGARWKPPPDFTTRRMSSVLARDEPDVLFTEACASAFSGHNRPIWEKARQAVEEAYTRLYSQDGLQVIHHDLWHDNIKLHRGQLSPLDFEDTVWGYPVQDIAMAMQDLMLDTPAERYEPLLAAFRIGYENSAAGIRSWPEAYESEMDTLRMGRMLWVANFVAHKQPQHLEGYLERNTPLLERFLDTGKLRKPSPA